MWRRWFDPRQGACFALVFVERALAPSLALACSGEGASAAMVRNALFGWVSWLVTLVVFVAFARSARLRAGGVRTYAAFVFVLLVHPGWWFPTTSGDCGTQRVELGVAATLLAIVVGAMVFLRAGSAAKRAARSSEES